MHMAAGKVKKKLVDEINITPLTDVFLVLLIIMMVVAPMIKTTRREIIPPKVEGGVPLERVKLVVEVTRDGVYFVDGDQVEESKLAEVLRAKAGQYLEKDVVIQADKLTKSRATLRVFDAAREAGFEKMTVAVEMLQPSREKELQRKAPPEGAASL